MKRVIVAIAAMVLAVIMMSLAACSEAGVVLPSAAPTDAPAPTEAPDTLSGTYKLVEVSGDGKTVSAAQMEASGISGTLVITGETAKLTMDNGDGNVKTANLTVDTEKKTLTDENGSPANYTVSGNRITVEQTGYKMVFEKQ